eukprot:Gb_30928 [translate_table: standard]
MRRTEMGSQNPSELDSSYPDSVSSSPRSVGRGRGTDSEYSGSHRWEDSSSRVRFMCSYGGRILPRPHDNQLRYVGGDTRIVAVNRNISYSVLITKLSKLCGSNVSLKYQLPNEDLDALISVTTDEDLDNMMEEYDRLQQSGNKSSRLRLFLFPAKLESATSLGSLLESSKREHWFVDALNGAPLLARGRSEVSSVVSEVPDYLFGLDNIEDWERDDRSSQKAMANPPARKSRMFVQQEGLNAQSPEVHSAPGSPMPESSPYCSTSSAPPCMNSHVVSVEDLPPVKVKAEQQNEQQVSRGVETGYARFETPTSEDVHSGPDMIPPSRTSVDSSGVQEIGLRTQDPRLVFDDHMTKINFQGKPILNSNPPKNPLHSPEVPVQEFQHLHISNSKQDNLRGDDVIPEEISRYESPRNAVNPVPKSPPMNRESSQSSLTGAQREGNQSDLPGLRREGSSSSLASLKRDGSGSNLSAYGDETRNPLKQEEISPPIIITTGQMKQERKLPDAVKAMPNPQRQARALEEEVRPDEIYMQKPPEPNTMVMQPNPAEHYVEHSSHFVQQGQQPLSYWQVADTQLQQGDQPVPVYFVPAQSPVLHTMSTTVRPTGQPAYMPVQRMGIAPMNAPAVYSADVLSSKPVHAVQAQSQAPPGPIHRQASDKLAGVTQGISYREPVPAKAVSKIPVYRGRPVPTDMRMMMRPTQPVAPHVMHMPPDQYAYQQMQPVVYETNVPPPQVYYTQKASIINPQYQGMVPVSADLQPATEMLSEPPNSTRVSQSL